MNPFQFYVVERFPPLGAGESISTQVQMTITGEDEPVQTEITSVKPQFEQGLSLLKIRSEVKHDALGYIKVVRAQNREKINFHEYLEPVDFYAYHDPNRNVVLFQAPRAICRGVLSNLSMHSDQVKLQEMEVDFKLVLEQCNEYLGAWFRGVSTRVSAAGLSGNQIQNDHLFRQLLRFGHLSNVTIPWVFAGVEHKVMVTQRGSIVLVQNYRNNQSLELGLVMDVYDRLLQKVWHPRKIAADDKEADLVRATEDQ